ncbi:MAG: response regulator [Methanomassiliicoccales archaeon]
MLIIVLSGDLTWPEGWTFSVWFILLCYSMIIYLYRKDPSLLEERFKKPGTGNEEGWDKYVVAGLVVGFIVCVVIMDLNIPGGLGGRETIRKLQERYTKINAIVSSGYSNDPITANYVSYGFKGVLPKPYTMKQLEEAIQKAMV